MNYSERERYSFEKDYPVLRQLFINYFGHIDYFLSYDEDIVAKYVEDCNQLENGKETLEATKKELESLLIHVEKYWEEFEWDLEKYFRNTAEALAWVTSIKQEFDKWD